MGVLCILSTVMFTLSRFGESSHPGAGFLFLTPAFPDRVLPPGAATSTRPTMAASMATSFPLPQAFRAALPYLYFPIGDVPRRDSTELTAALECAL